MTTPRFALRWMKREPRSRRARCRHRVGRGPLNANRQVLLTGDPLRVPLLRGSR
jgi:hypothetical protein